MVILDCTRVGSVCAGRVHAKCAEREKRRDRGYDLACGSQIVKKCRRRLKNFRFEIERF